MKLNRLFFGLTVLCALTCVFAGCNKGGGGSRSGLVKAAGTVTYKGELVSDAIIEMRPIDESMTNCVATARTDEKGAFTLMTDRPGDGAVPGKYRAVVKKEVQMLDGIPLSEYIEKEKQAGNEEVQYNKDKVVNEQFLPVKYGDPLNSPLEIEIPSGGNKNIEIVLED
ncbi:MAG: hypothetical protein IKX88_01775 [Thermoguttaceae bacterium]|nr:hypothetical protein [Thermoguttaceae bacterium]